MQILETFEEIFEKIVFIVNLILDAFVNVHDALNEFYNMLKEFNDTVIQMTIDPSSNSGLPVVESIGVFRYLVGDVAFYVIYMIILFGCLFTIYKLVCLLMEGLHALKEQVSAGSYSGSALSSILSNFFK